MKLTRRALAKTGSTTGAFTKEGWLVSLNERTAFWDRPGGCGLIDLGSGERTELGIAGSSSPGVVVASADGHQVVICEMGGWVRLVTLEPTKKPKVKRTRLHPKLALSGAGFTSEHVVLRSAYPDHIATLHDRSTLAKVGTVKSKTVVGISASGAVLDVSSSTSLWLPPFTKAQPVAKEPLKFVASSADGATILTRDGANNDYVTIDTARGQVVGRLRAGTLSMERDDRLLPLDSTQLVRIRHKLTTHYVQETTIEIWTMKGKNVASLKLLFNASKSERGLAEQILVAPSHIVLNSETIVDVG